MTGSCCGAVASFAGVGLGGRTLLRTTWSSPSASRSSCSSFVLLDEGALPRSKHARASAPDQHAGKTKTRNAAINGASHLHLQVPVLTSGSK